MLITHCGHDIDGKNGLRTLFDIVYEIRSENFITVSPLVLFISWVRRIHPCQQNRLSQSGISTYLYFRIQIDTNNFISSKVTFLPLSLKMQSIFYQLGILVNVSNKRIIYNF